VTTVIKTIRALLTNENARLLIAAVSGALATRYIPAAFNMIARGVSWAIRKLSRTVAAQDFRAAYLDWLVTENRELRLAGVVTIDETKKPTLEQVFVSLYIGKGQSVVSHINDAPTPRAFQVVRTWRELHEALVRGLSI
jgi:hypothetical protein